MNNERILQGANGILYVVTSRGPGHLDQVATLDEYLRAWEGMGSRRSVEAIDRRPEAESCYDEPLLPSHANHVKLGDCRTATRRRLHGQAALRNMRRTAKQLLAQVTA